MSQTEQTKSPLRIGLLACQRVKIKCLQLFSQFIAETIADSSRPSFLLRLSRYLYGWFAISGDWYNS